MSGALELRFLREGGQTVAATSPASWSPSSRRRRRDVAIAIYDFHVEHAEAAGIAATLQGLRDRGVRVRILDHDEREVKREVPDNVPRPPAPPEYIDSLGLDVRPVIGFGTLMHHKYVVIDGERVWTGSHELDRGLLHAAGELHRHGREPRARGGLPARLRACSGSARATSTRAAASTREWSDATYGGQAVRVRPFFCPGRGPELAALIGTPHRVRARARDDLLAGAHVRADPGRARRRRRARRRAGHRRRRPHPDARRAAPVGRAAEGVVEAAGVPLRRRQGQLRRQAQHPVGPARPCTTSCTPRSSSATTGRSSAPTTTRARARRTPRTCSRSTARPCADRVAEAIGEFAVRYATGRRRPLVAGPA